jgi:hypothetical protein
MRNRTAQWLNAQLSMLNAAADRQWFIPVPNWAGCQLERFIGGLLYLAIADPGAADDDRL